MKKVVRTVWISLLSGLAFLGACCTPKAGHNRTECLYGSPEILEAENPDEAKAARRAELRQQLDSLKQTLQRRETACVYGSPEVLERYGQETNVIRRQADSIRNELRALDSPEKAIRRAEIQQQLDSLNAILERREHSAVYGSPEVMNRYRKETTRIRQEADSLRIEMEQLDDEE